MDAMLERLNFAGSDVVEAAKVRFRRLRLREAQTARAATEEMRPVSERARQGISWRDQARCFAEQLMLQFLFRHALEPACTRHSRQRPMQHVQMITM